MLVRRGDHDSRPKELTIVQGLGFLKGSRSPHYDKERTASVVSEVDRVRAAEAGLRVHNDAVFTSKTTT